MAQAQTQGKARPKPRPKPWPRPRPWPKPRPGHRPSSAQALAQAQMGPGLGPAGPGWHSLLTKKGGPRARLDPYTEEKGITRGAVTPYIKDPATYIYIYI